MWSCARTTLLALGAQNGISMQAAEGSSEFVPAADDLDDIPEEHVPPVTPPAEPAAEPGEPSSAHSDGEVALLSADPSPSSLARIPSPTP